MTLGRKYKEPSIPSSTRRDNLNLYKTDKIQEEPTDDATSWREDCTVDGSTSVSACTSNTNLVDTTSSLSVKSYETSPTESSSNIDYKAYKPDAGLSKTFENRLLAAENLIKESQLRNLGPARFNRNLSSSYRDTDKCDKESLDSISEATTSASKRRSCIPSLRLRSGSLTRESGSLDRRNSFACSQDVHRAVSPDKSILGKLFAGRTTSPANEKQKPKHRISRFLRPDFFDTPREESQYVKEKEAQKAAENERRKSRFIKRKTEKVQENGDEKREKELKNEINSLKRDQPEEEPLQEKVAKNEGRQGSKSSFLHSLEKKLEKLRSNDEPKLGNGVGEQVVLRETSAPPECPPVAQEPIKRTSSVENVSGKTGQRSRVSSVLGLFKADAKQANGRTQSAILGKLKKSPPKCAAPPDGEETSPGTRIPKSRSDSKKKPVEVVKKPPEKKSPPKEKVKVPGSKEKQKLPERQKEAKKEGEPEQASAKKPNSNEVEPTSESPPEAGCAEDKKLLKTKKNSSLLRSASTEPGKPEDVDKKPKKIVKAKDSAEKEEANGAKKKKIVRVVRKVVKKSPDGEKTEEKKTSKILLKKKTTTEKSPEPVAVGGSHKLKAKEGNFERTTGRFSVRACSLEDADRPSKMAIATEDSSGISKPLKSNDEGTPERKTADGQRAIRSGLKLDLSKIPQHTFSRNATPKKDSPKSDSPKADSPKTGDGHPEVPDKLIDCLSKMTHRASIAGSKIIIDKPLRAKDVAELKREVTECARIIESHVEANQDDPVSRSLTDTASSTDPATRETQLPEDPPGAEETGDRLKGSPSEFSNELLSPGDPESFDSWSLSSADFNQPRTELHSPTSPSHALFLRSDNSESVIDRIRRRSFYSRFNDRKRPSLTAPPPGVSLPTSLSLPRKFSLVGARDRPKYAGKSAREKNRVYAYEEEPAGLKKVSLGRERYSEASPYIGELKSPSEHYGSISSYDPLRRFLRSPTFDLPTTRPRYHSVDFGAETDRSHLLDEGHSSATLPRRYGSATSAEPKTVEYYEELLAPSNADYLAVRRSPLPNDYLNRCENGYHNGNSDLHLNAARRKSYAEKMGGTDFAQDGDLEVAEHKRNRSTSESKNLPSTSLEEPPSYSAD